MVVLREKPRASRGKRCWDFPGDPVVKNQPSNAEDEGSIPGWGTKIPHAEGQLSPGVTTREKFTSCNKDPLLQLKTDAAKKKKRGKGVEQFSV